MATKTLAKAKTTPSPTELRDLIRATLAEYFPKCEDASLVFIPAPGVSPVEMRVRGDVLGEAGVVDEWHQDGAGYWRPDITD